MWFRIELDRTGAILSCKQADGSIGEGRLIRYIEADSSEAAVALAQAWFRRRSSLNAATRRLREKRKSNSKCYQCGQLPWREGAALCERHKDAQQRRKREKRHGRPPLTLAPRSPEEIARQMERIRKSGAERLRRFTRKRLSDTELNALQMALVAFDSMTPRAFRTWLVNEIERREPAKVAAAE